MVAVKGSSSTGQEETENYDDVMCNFKMPTSHGREQ